MSETAKSPKAEGKRSPFKTRHESLGYFFGQPLDSFENLLQPSENTQPSTSAAVQSKKPTDLEIIRQWIYVEDQNRTTRSHSDVNSITRLLNANII